MPYKDIKVRKQKAKERWISWSERHDSDGKRRHQWVTNYRNSHREKFLFLSAKSRAKRDGLEFNISESDIVIPNKCPVFGIPLSINKNRKGPSPNSPTLDRINPNLGYTKGNIEVISWKANKYKSDMSLEVLEQILCYMKSRSV